MCRGLLLHLIRHNDARAHTHTHTLFLSLSLSRKDSPERGIGPSHGPLLAQHTTFIRDRHPYPWRDSNPQSQQANSRRPTPKTARTPRSKHFLKCDIFLPSLTLIYCEDLRRSEGVIHKVNIALFSVSDLSATF
jgi:hypothetical protein